MVKLNKLNFFSNEINKPLHAPNCFPKSEVWSLLGLLWRVPNFKECQCVKPCQKFLSKLWLNEKTWSHTGDQKKAKFLKVINNLIIYKFFKEFINHKKKTNRVVVFSCRCIPNILKYWDHSLNFPKIRKLSFIETQIEKLRWYIWKFSFTVLQNYHWNTMKTKILRVIKVGSDPT